MHLSPPPLPVAWAAVRSKAVVLLLLVPLWDSVIVLCFVERYFVSILVYSHLDVEEGGWLICFVFLLVTCDCYVSLSRCATGFVCVLNLLFINCLWPSYGSL